MTSDSRFAEYKKIWLMAARVGSRVTCVPAPTDTDEDWLILCAEERWRLLEDQLISDGWALDGSDISDDANEIAKDERFVSFSNTVDAVRVNFIITRSPEFYRRFIAGTDFAKRLNLLQKADRVALFQAVLYGNSCAEPELGF